MGERSASPGLGERLADVRAVDRVVGSDRVLAVLAELGRHPAGIGLDELAAAVGSPKPTVHRALVSLRRARFANRDGHGHYVLGDEILRMAFAHQEARPDHVRIKPLLEALSARFGETTHYAVLDGRFVVYRSKVDPEAGAVRLTSVVGGRNPAHCTAVGKVLLCYALPEDGAVRDWVGDSDLITPTGRGPGNVQELSEELRATRTRGFGLDDQENEPGVNCLAVPVFLTSPTVPSGAVSISGLAYRTPLRLLLDDLPTILEIISSHTSDGVS
jgi:IclR family transcriptional regulator, acetate operon repressor